MENLILWLAVYAPYTIGVSLIGVIFLSDFLQRRVKVKHPQLLPN